MENAFGDFLELIQGLDDLQEVQDQFTQYIESLGFHQFTYHILRNRFVPNANSAYITTYPNCWVEKYLECQYQRLDPVVTSSHNFFRPFQWQDKLAPEGLTDEQQDFFRKADAYGVGDGITVPIHSYDGEFALMNFVGEHSGDKLTALFREQEHVLHIAALQFHLIAKKLLIEHATLGSKPQITEREREVMLWVLKGKTSWEISLILGVSERTVNFHISNVTEKLGVTSRLHAVILLMMHGIFEP